MTLQTLPTSETERYSRRMHIHFVRSVWRWFLGCGWEAEMHMKFALQAYECLQFELERRRT